VQYLQVLVWFAKTQSLLELQQVEQIGPVVDEELHGPAPVQSEVAPQVPSDLQQPLTHLAASHMPLGFLTPAQ